MMEKNEFIDIFREEAKERLQNLEEGIISLGKKGGGLGDNVDALMREAHTLKGSARMVGLKEFGEAAHLMEGILTRLKKGELPPNQEVKDLLLNATRAMHASIIEGDDTLLKEFLERETSKESGPTNREVEKQKSKKPKPESEDSFVLQKEKSSKTKGGVGFLKLPVEKVEKVTIQAEELYMKAQTLKREGEEKVDTRSVESLIEDIKELNQELGEMRLVPIRDLFHELVMETRSLSKELGKKIHLNVSGEDERLDKRIVELLREPLLHLIRNAVDHGIESKRERRNANKPETGTIWLRAYTEKNYMVVEIEDDGRGIDVDKIREKLRESGMSSEVVKEISDEEALQFIFKPGFSTKSSPTKISGRGVGLDVVQEVTRSVGGFVLIQSKKGKGTKITLRVPLTLSTERVIFTKIAGENYGFPTREIEKIRLFKEESLTLYEGKSFYDYDGKLIQIIDLPTYLYGTNPTGNFLLITKEPTFAFRVDSLSEENEIVMKTIPGFLGEVPYIDGVTRLKTDELAFIPNVRKLKTLAKQCLSAIRSTTFLGVNENNERRKEEKKEERPRILVVEDAPLQRNLIAGMLEGAGFEVIQAEDGLDALRKLSKYKNINAIISDIEMPNLDGYSMVKRIRGNPEYSEIPVIFVTSRGSEEEIQKGLEVGADHYLVKGKFSSEELIELVKESVYARR